jgi:hypothetical protein
LGALFGLSNALAAFALVMMQLLSQAQRRVALAMLRLLSLAAVPALPALAV